jgi:hypothetical protein
MKRGSDTRTVDVTKETECAGLSLQDMTAGDMGWKVEQGQQNNGAVNCFGPSR